MSNDITVILRRIANVVINEAKTNEAFAANLEQAINKSRGRSQHRHTAVLNPFDLIGNEEVLLEKLNGLTEAQLKDIIADYRLDITNCAMQWRKKDRLIKCIIDGTRRKTEKGNAFRN